VNGHILTLIFFVVTINETLMQITCDEAKRLWTLNERGLDFEHAPFVFEGPHLTVIDERRDYGEVRYITVGYLEGRMVFVIWTQREENYHIISMRKANEREQRTYTLLLVGGG
jgi:uncharacterized protein